MAEKRRYPIGLQYFPEIIQRNGVYVDKTEYVYNMANSVGKYYFLSRPRRFGKSLLVSTLEAYFMGRKELFEGLKIAQLETEWIEYPVIRLDLSLGKYYDLDTGVRTLWQILLMQEQKWGLPVNNEDSFGNRLTRIIQAAYEQTGREVVVLIDEYDAPMLDSITKPELQEQLRERVRNLFSPLKAMNQYLRFVFLTGISKFSQQSAFSGFNNLEVITYDPEYEGICGITEEELLTQMKPDIEWLAQEMEMTYEETVAELKRRYDGYHFSKRMTDVYNPWSLIYAFKKGEISDYWFSTGTPTSLLNLFRLRDISMAELEGKKAYLEDFDAPTDRITDPVPVLFQSGYLTLKGYDRKEDEFTLGFPNEEVRRGFANSLYRYLTPDYWDSSTTMTGNFRRLRRGDITIEQYMERLCDWYAGMPYAVTDRNQNEQFYQALLYALLVSGGADVRAEEMTSDGRMDIALLMPKAIYIMEFKLDLSADEAMAQIRSKNYAVRYAADPRPKFGIAVSVDKDRRKIAEWKVEAL